MSKILVLCTIRTPNFWSKFDWKKVCVIHVTLCYFDFSFFDILTVNLKFGQKFNQQNWKYKEKMWYICFNSFTRYAVDDDKSSISYTQSSSYFRWKVNVAWGINQVDQESIAALWVLLSLDVLQIILLQFIVQRDGTERSTDTVVLWECSARI